MGDIADGLINGDFDFYTGEYLGRGYGIPRTGNRSLPWERKNKKKEPIDFSTNELAYKGIVNYIEQKWSGKAYRPTVRAIVSEYVGEENINLKKKCLEIQKDFGKFCKWVNNKIKNG